MNKLALLGELRALAENAPSFEKCDPASQVQQSWLGKVHALLSKWNMEEANVFRNSANGLGAELLQANNLTKIFGVLHLAIADLELQVPAVGAGTSGPGVIYDFTKELRELLTSAMETLFIVDPTLDEQVFAGYLSTVQPQVVIRLLVRAKADALISALSVYVGQKNMAVELRESEGVHDRIVCVDGRSCWVLGQPIKVSVKKKQSYLAPLSVDVSELKMKYYEGIWGRTKG